MDTGIHLMGAEEACRVSSQAFLRRYVYKEDYIGG
jgi:hypothetical protein